MVCSEISDCPKGGDALLEDADDGEGNAEHGDVFVDRIPGTSEELNREGLHDNGYRCVGRGVHIVEEASGEDDEIADFLVLGRDPEEHGVFGDAATDGDAVVELKHGGGGDDAGHGLDDGVHILAGHVVRRAGVIGAHGGAADVLHFHLVGADIRDGVESVLLAGETDGDDQDDGGGADDHAEHGKQEADLGGAKAVDGQAADLAEEHGRARGCQGCVKGCRSGGRWRGHERKDWTQIGVARVRQFLLTSVVRGAEPGNPTAEGCVSG